MSNPYDSAEFEKKYTYPGRDLGAFWSEEKTVFRVWAPTARAVSLLIYREGSGGEPLARQRMHPDVNGTWFAQRYGNLNGLYYTYLVTVDGQTREACDPYARAVGVNGQRAMVLDLKSTDPEGWETDHDPFPGKGITDAVLYELHIRDLSMHRSSHIRHKGKFLGLTETGRKTRGGHPTGLDHIRELGVTHIHLMPVFDFGYPDESAPSPQYNWGYDPVNFNVPEGSYASDPFHGETRVREMKLLVKAVHDAGLSVVMDVVYNHVYDAGSFCFNRIVPGYFSRIDEHWHYSNGSCCGNDTASERSMVRKFIVDSVNFWADEYHIDGFRFDLMGLLDIATVNEIVRTVQAQHPNVIFYAEGWHMDTQPVRPGTELAVQDNSSKMPGFSFFNDTLRDLLRGSIFDSRAPGFVSGAICDKGQLNACFMGMPFWAGQPEQCVNYVSCHDNNTLFDRLAIISPEASFETRVRQNCLAAAFVFLSQGVTFLQAGEEMLRSKPKGRGRFDENSYRSPDRVNALRWNDLDKPEYQAVFQYYRGLLAFRKAHEGLRQTKREAVCQTVSPVEVENPRAVAYRVEDRYHSIYIIFNADGCDLTLPLPPGRWEVNIHDQQAGTEPLFTAEGQITVRPVSATVLTRKKPVDVVAALIWEKDKFLICQRPEHKTRGLMWEFVGGKVEPGETMEQALERECAEELAVRVSVGSQFLQEYHDYPDMLIRLTLFHCSITSGVPQALEHRDLQWIHPSQIGLFQFCPADENFLKEIQRVYENHKPL
ncbi:MAG: type I pullulanase [Candidatus Faecousia sp.]|nr:type I pullulanase [Candidatus Faecousia sp.]